MTTADAAALPRDAVAVLPVASIEQHGPHLPLSTDMDIAAGVLARALELMPPELPVLDLPPWSIGFCPEHAECPGTLGLPAETLIQAWLGIGAAVRRSGVRRLVVFNGHGGNPPVMDIVAFELRRLHGMLVLPVSVGALGLPSGLLPESEIRDGIHGGAMETSLMLHLRPDLVRRDLIRPRTGEARPALLPGLGWMARDLGPDGIAGDPSLASAGIGRALLEHLARELAQRIAALHRLPEPPHA